VSTEALKFLRHGAVGRFSGFAWPAPGEWVHAAAGPLPCRSAIHACRVRDLPIWLDEELWVVELDGEIAAEETKIAAASGRLVRRVDAWDPDVAQQFASACAERVVDPGYADDARGLAAAGVAAAAAYVAARAGDWATERAWQAAWLSDRLGLGAFA
jgi:hypothetical protein